MDQSNQSKLWKVIQDGSSSTKLLILLGCAFSLLVFKISATIIYNIYFHPLRKYPGPKIAAATTFTYYIISCQGRIVPWTQQIHEKYGEVVRVGPDRLSYISAQAWKDIYGHRTAKRPENPKDTRLYVKAVNGEHTIVSVPDARDHGSIRKIFSNAFSDKALKLQEPLIQKYVDKLIMNIHKEVNAQPSTELDLVMLYNCTTFDIMGDLAFGEPLGLLEQSGYTPWVKAIFKSIKAAQFMRIGLEFPLLGKIIEKLLMPQSLMNKRREHFQYSADRVDRRMEKGTDKPDIWNLVLKNGTGQLSTGEMHSNAATFMLAGTETTATLLSGLTYHLLKNPDKMERVVKEIRSLSEDDLSLENLPRMPYLSACFEEGLRCYPPVPSALFREVADGGNQICGQWIPPKTRVGVPQFAAFHSPLNFKDPHSFVPERWLPGTGYDSDKKDAMQPFSVGPRNCLGKNLAYHEMRIILAKVLWNFDLELCPQSDSWADQECFILWEKPGLFVRAKSIR